MTREEGSSDLWANLVWWEVSEWVLVERSKATLVGSLEQLGGGSLVHFFYVVLDDDSGPSCCFWKDAQKSPKPISLWWCSAISSNSFNTSINCSWCDDEKMWMTVIIIIWDEILGCIGIGSKCRRTIIFHLLARWKLVLASSRNSVSSHCNANIWSTLSLYCTITKQNDNFTDGFFQPPQHGCFREQCQSNGCWATN